jgi:lysophospholipase L1-like esterase
VFPQEFHGRYFNVDVIPPTGHAYRRTTSGGAPSAGQLVLVLGGSTVYDSEVPDEHTVPSRLAAVLWEAKARAVTVLNAGVTSANTAQELERLEAELRRGLRPDLVISYTGVNDALQGVYFGDPAGVMFSSEKRSKEVFPPRRGFRSFVKTNAPPWVYAAGRELLAFARPTRIYQALKLRARYRQPRSKPAHMMDDARVGELARETGRLFEEHLLTMHRLGEQRGYRFHAFLQPQIYSAQGYRERGDVDFVARFDAIRYPLIEKAFPAAYAELRGAVSRLRLQGVRVHDISGLFDGKTEAIFLDSHHVNSSGNRAIARAIASSLDEAGP